MKTNNKKSLELSKALKITLNALIFVPSIVIFTMFAFAINWDDITYLDPTLPNIFSLIVENFVDYLGKLF